MRRPRRHKHAPKNIRPRIVWDDFGNAKCIWRGVRAGPSVHQARNIGLFATIDLCAGSKIPYFGVRLTRNEYEAQMDQTYTVAIHPVQEADQREMIDGNPSWYERWTPTSGHLVYMPKVSKPLERLPSELMLGGCVNEPVPGEKLSLKLVGTSKCAYFLATRDIAAGEELLGLYGEDYKRDYPSPYDWYDKQALAEWRAFWT